MYAIILYEDQIARISFIMAPRNQVTEISNIQDNKDALSLDENDEIIYGFHLGIMELLQPRTKFHMQQLCRPVVAQNKKNASY